jgi:hypothetical protein
MEAMARSLVVKRARRSPMVTSGGCLFYKILERKSGLDQPVSAGVLDLPQCAQQIGFPRQGVSQP